MKKSDKIRIGSKIAVTSTDCDGLDDREYGTVKAIYKTNGEKVNEANVNDRVYFDAEFVEGIAEGVSMGYGIEVLEED